MKSSTSRQVVLLLVAFAVANWQFVGPRARVRDFKALFRVERSWVRSAPSRDHQSWRRWQIPGLDVPLHLYGAARRSNRNRAPISWARRSRFRSRSSPTRARGHTKRKPTFPATPRHPSLITPTERRASDQTSGHRVRPGCSSRPRWATRFRTYGSGNPVSRPPPSAVSTTSTGRDPSTSHRDRTASRARCGCIYRPASSFYQYIYKYAPLVYKAYGSFKCERAGVDCNYLDTEIGETTTSGMVTRFLLNVKGTGTGNSGTIPIPPKPPPPPSPTDLAPTPYGNKSFITAKNYYLHQINPWTTGFVSVYNY